MARTVLITGGAGFIGSHLADELLQSGYQVRAIDNLDAQIHGDGPGGRGHLDPAVEFLPADIRDPVAVRRALVGVDHVVHLAAMVGVGQSMYRIADYVAVNDLGTAVLLEALIERPVERLVVASSMSIYGEGAYRDADGALVTDPVTRPEPAARQGFEPLDATGRPLRPVPTSEDKAPDLASVYALTKYVQERTCLLIGASYGIPTMALRFFNVFGPRQALSNPYTGVLAIFAARLLNGRRPVVFEDGGQRRDFVAVRDVARACRLALEQVRTRGVAVNVGSGVGRTVESVALDLARVLGRDALTPEITGRHRQGDVRHCFADPGFAERALGFRAEVGFDEGLGELAAWLAGQRAVDRVDAATAELAQRGLVA